MNRTQVLAAGTLLAGMLAFHTQAAAQKRPRKPLKELLQTADSLRLQMRHAADNGRLLQWGDSLLRERLHRGDIDSARYERMHERLARYDRQLFSADSLLALNYRKKNLDTLYVGRPDTRWTVKLRGNISGAKLTTNGRRDGAGHRVSVKSDYRGTLSVSAAYRGLGLGVAVNPAKFANENKDFEFNLNSYGNKMGFDIVYLSSNTYHGSQTMDGATTGITKGMLRQSALNLNFYYAFSHRRFSFPAAFTQSYIQRRSAGSWMAGASFDGSATDIAADPAAGTPATKIRLAELAVGAGYGYNLVAGRHWLLHLSALPTLTVYSHDDMTTGGAKQRMKYTFPSAIITGRGAATYFWRNKFAGLVMVYNYSVAGDEDRLQMRREKWRTRMFYGFRF